jgi:hypothetical protein
MCRVGDRGVRNLSSAQGRQVYSVVIRKGVSVICKINVPFSEVLFDQFIIF